MRKIILSMLLLLAGATTYAQVGINKEVPQATLDINAKEESSPSNKVEGLLIPRVSKQKALLMGGNGELQESTLIYVNDFTYVSSDAAVEDITENGYYFWNGTKWVKSSGNNGSIWKKLANENIYLDDNSTKDSVYYTKGGGFRLAPKQKIDFTPWHGSDGYVKKDIDYQNKGYTTSYITNDGYASNIPYKPDPSDNPNYSVGTFKSNSLLVDNGATQHSYGYITSLNSLLVPAENTNNFHTLYGIANKSSHEGKGTVENVMGAFNLGSLGSPDSKALFVRGAYNQATTYSEKQLNFLEASYNYASPRGSGEISNVYGTRNYTNLKKGFSSTVRNLVLTRNQFEINTGSSAPQGGTIDNLYGTYTTFDRIVGSSVTIKKMYGMYIGDVVGGTDDNYAIFTDAGNIRFGDLANSKAALAGKNRLVITNAEGVLSASDDVLEDFVSLWANDDTNHLVKLKKTSTGADRVDAQGDPSRNSITISDAGAITAKGFIGYNGASIFPDYVFEKYYKGYSNIKADYNFHNLASVEAFVKKNGHLPGYQSAKEIAKKGLIDIGATQLTNIEKIEELYLHLIEKDKEVKELKEEVKELKALVNKLINK